jgi:uncharacterized protein YdiU (UPF0061 family)
MRRITDLAFENSYARLHPAFYDVVNPTSLPEPYLVAWSPAAATLLDLDPNEGANPDISAYLSGERRLPGSEPIAQVYAGHQFGVWVPRLGDGRAFLLGEVRNGRGESWDLHLKGGGRTAFSRGGDGRSVLRSAVREYLCSEAMHGLGIPTTRALAVVGSDLPVRRETVETAATLLRLSPSHVRFGTFEYFAARGEAARLRELADYVIGRHFPEVAGTGSPYRAFLGEVVRTTAHLIAQWMAVGFCHGVLNTDNMSVLGITLDYGPFGFLDAFDAGHICNHSDIEGRYAYDQQPAIGLWNLARFAEALLPLLPEAEARDALDGYPIAFAAEYGRLMRAKLGLTLEHPGDAELVRDLLMLLQAHRVDYTEFFRALGSAPAASSASAGNETWQAWRRRYEARLAAEPSRPGTADMMRVNPRYVLRNWIAQEAIEHAQRKEFGRIEEIRRVLAAPFEEHPGFERYAEPPTAAAGEIEVSCSS